MSTTTDNTILICPLCNQDLSKPVRLLGSGVIQFHMNCHFMETVRHKYPDLWDIKESFDVHAERLRLRLTG